MSVIHEGPDKVPRTIFSFISREVLTGPTVGVFASTRWRDFPVYDVWHLHRLTA
jgi:hypothetical protein